MQLNCALSLLFLFTYLFFSHRMWFISGHKNKGSCWCCFIFFSCNQLASEIHSFWLWPHSHWNQWQSFPLTSFRVGLDSPKGNVKVRSEVPPKIFTRKYFFLALAQQSYLGCTEIERSHEIFLYSHPSFSLKWHWQFILL